MKPEESVAFTYLSSLNLGTFVYEPDGNIPPDFALNNSIAVEVRRLNENHFAGTEAEGLEQLSIPLNQTLARVLSDYDGVFSGATYWVNILFERSFPRSRKEITVLLHDALNSFLANVPSLPVELRITDSIKLHIHNATPKLGKVFRHAGSTDWDSGGFLVPLFVENISHCLKDKEPKIVNYRSNYEAWWLLLVDNIGWDMLDDEEIEIKTAIGSLHNFNKLIVINGNGSKHLLELS